MQLLAQRLLHRLTTKQVGRLEQLHHPDDKLFHLLGCRRGPKHPLGYFVDLCEFSKSREPILVAYTRSTPGSKKVGQILPFHKTVLKPPVKTRSIWQVKSTHIGEMFKARSALIPAMETLGPSRKINRTRRRSSPEQLSNLLLERNSTLRILSVT